MQVDERPENFIMLFNEFYINLMKASIVKLKKY